MRPFQIQVDLICFLTYTFHGNRSHNFIILGESGILLTYSSIFQDFAKFRSDMFVIFTSYPLSATTHIVVLCRPNHTMKLYEWKCIQLSNWPYDLLQPL